VSASDGAREVLARVLEIVLRVAGPHRTPPGAAEDVALGEGGFWLDSVELLEIVVACEEAFAVALDPDADLTREGLRDARALASRIAAKLQG
jgi:acyl carrier protein